MYHDTHSDVTTHVILQRTGPKNNARFNLNLHLASSSLRVTWYFSQLCILRILTTTRARARAGSRDKLCLQTKRNASEQIRLSLRLFDEAGSRSRQLQQLKKTTCTRISVVIRVDDESSTRENNQRFENARVSFRQINREIAVKKL